MLSLGGHIGAKATALIDGQLPPEEEERAWSHVVACPGCRHQVEREGWIKRQLGTLSDRGELPDRLMGSLYDVDAAEAWTDVDVIERRSVRAVLFPGMRLFGPMPAVLEKALVATKHTKE